MQSGHGEALPAVRPGAAGELALLLEIGKWIGTLPTVGLIVVTGLVGAYLARRQGLSVLRRMREETAAGHIPAGSVVDGVLILIAGALLMTPGVLTRRTWASSRRSFRGLRAIIEILSRFDVIALQEVKGDLRALRDTIRFLGDDWAFLMSDITFGAAGNDERLAFFFHRTRCKPSGLAAELVVPAERLHRIGANALREQFARSPYAVSFQREDATFILTTLHVLFGDVAADRTPELQEIADWMRDWAPLSQLGDHRPVEHVRPPGLPHHLEPGQNRWWNRDPRHL